MSCPDELTLCMHADRELSADDALRVADHLQTCADCRALLASLEQENTVLSGALREQESPGAELVAWRGGVGSDRDTATHEATWGGSARPWMIGVAALVAVAPLMLDWLWQATPSLPPGFRWVGNLGGVGGMVSVLSGLASLLGGGQDMWLSSFGFVITLFVVLGGLGVTALRRHPFVATATALLLVSLGALAPPIHARAAEFRYEEEGTVRVDAGEVIEDTVFLAGKTAIVAGVVDGDVFAAAERVEVTGEIRGNLYGAGESVTVAGDVGGNAHLAGQDVELDARVGGSAFVAGQNLALTAESQIARDGFLAGETVRSRGLVGKDVYVAAERIELGGKVERNVRGYGSQVSLTSSGAVGGDLRLTVPSEDAVVLDDGATIGGGTEIEIEERDEYRPFVSGGFYFGVIAKALAMLLLGFVLAALFPSLVPTRPTSSGQVLREMGIGFAALVATPVVVLLVAITVIGIPVSIVLGVLYLALLFLSSLVVAYFAVARLPTFGQRGVGIALRTGLALLAVLLLTEVPFIGGGLCFLILIFGLGSILLHLRDLYVGRRGPEAPAAA